MYVCPVCGKRKFEKEDWIRKHYLACWKEHNPYHQSVPALQLEDIVEKQIDNGVMEFFKQYDR